MLKKDQRIKGKREFQKIFQRSHPFYFQYLKIRTLNIDSSQRGKVGLIISSKVSKKAVERNRLKRQLRVIFRPLLDRGILKGKAVAVTVFKKPNLKNSKERFEQDINQWLKKLF